MFWRSVVVKLWFTILLFFSFVLITLTILLLQFFESYHVNEAEQDLMQTANVVTKIVGDYHDSDLSADTIEKVMDPSNRIVVFFDEKDYWISGTSDKTLESVELDWFYSDTDLNEVLLNHNTLKKIATLPHTNTEVVIVGQPLQNNQGAVFVYQSLDKVEETTSQTTRLIILAAGIAIVLTTFFAFFLSTRITSPLIKMRKAAMELAKGEFHTKVPILTHDEIGELAIAFNRMGRQLKYNIHALNQEKEQAQSILTSMADGVISLNRDGEIVLTNPPADRFIDLLMYDREGKDQKNQNIAPNELRDALHQVISQEKEVMTDISAQGRIFVMIMSPLYNQSYVRGAVAVIRDMTEERQLDKLRKDFIANVSHELRTPISMLQGYSEAIKDDIAETKEEKNELAQIIYEEANRMGRLVNELLDLARMEAGHLTLDIEEVEVDPYLNKIYKKFHGLAMEKSIQFDLINEIQEKYVCIDPDRMEQVLTNLIDNAIRHTDEDGIVKLVAKSTQEHFIFTVLDNGSGIVGEDLPFIFERFYKADKSRAKTNGNTGTGLGLAIAKNIVEAAGGTINVHSKINEGTTFIVSLPKNSKK